MLLEKKFPCLLCYRVRRESCSCLASANTALRLHFSNSSNQMKWFSMAMSRIVPLLPMKWVLILRRHAKSLRLAKKTLFLTSLSLLWRPSRVERQRCRSTSTSRDVRSSLNKSARRWTLFLIRKTRNGLGCAKGRLPARLALGADDQRLTRLHSFPRSILWWWRPCR